MKFAGELENDIVQEWRVKYVDYSTGKHKIKAIVRAINRVHPSSRYHLNIIPINSLDFQPQSIFQTLDGLKLNTDVRASLEHDQQSQDDVNSLDKKSPTTATANITCSASSISTANKRRKSNIPSPIRLASVPQQQNTSSGPISRDFATNIGREDSNLSVSRAKSYPTANLGLSQTKGASSLALSRMPESPKSFISKIFFATPLSPHVSHQTDGNLNAIDLVKQRQIDFFKWIDREMEKVDNFYKTKENESDALIDTLQSQLHEMRNRRIKDLDELHNLRVLQNKDKRTQSEFGLNSTSRTENKKPHGVISSVFLSDLHKFAEKMMVKIELKVKSPYRGANSKALHNMPASPRFRNERLHQTNTRSDHYIPRVNYADNVPYRTAKKKLKLALLEAYRDMELLKSYSLINRAAFRKINRKYSRTVDAHHYTSLSEKVDMAWFVQSDALDKQMHNVIDLYARYFECGHEKIATEKLRRPVKMRLHRTAMAFRSGLMIGIGIAFSIQAVIYAVDLLHHPEPEIRMQTGYLLQIYAGFLLVFYLFATFCLNCYAWIRNKINYTMIFEFDSRHTLDWKELTEIPSLMIALLGLCAWLNFSKYGTNQFYIYWPVVLVSVTMSLLFLPAPTTFYRSRRWLLYTHWRLLLAGVYPVEFRDFFMGDIYCSLTYVMANIEVFFCLYIHHWGRPKQCGSSYSSFLGFLTTLPGIWRSFQCIRRYYDSGNMFPHLANFGKYLSTIAFYTTLSLYRRDRIYPKLIIFLAAASVNTVYTYIWDILMDWSLFQPNTKTMFLRDVRGLRNPWWYYIAIILNAFLKLTWIFYAFFPEGVGHSSLVTFIVALVEVTRRGIWVFFRVENEHCSNIENFKASRSLSLPYTTMTESQNENERPERPEEEHS
ncbi:hypothetical protein K3495_g7847 [Podosphaera aphanis]|nr:hypothetical protein K3495_g7847 [Podosphaera aphanis]